MIVLDTNVLSALARGRAETVVVGWLDRHAPLSIWTTAITVFEMRFGLHRLPAGKRRNDLAAALDVLFHERIGDRIAMLDADSAERSARFMAYRQAEGRPVDMRDAMIAGIAIASRATIATRNVSHFADVPVPIVNPWES